VHQPLHQPLKHHKQQVLLLHLLPPLLHLLPLVQLGPHLLLLVQVQLVQQVELG